MQSVTASASPTHASSGNFRGEVAFRVVGLRGLQRLVETKLQVLDQGLQAVAEVNLLQRRDGASHRDRAADLEERHVEARRDVLRGPFQLLDQLRLFGRDRHRLVLQAVTTYHQATDVASGEVVLEE